MQVNLDWFDQTSIRILRLQIRDLKIQIATGLSIDPL